jgi:phosphate:Na+ symporter
VLTALLALIFMRLYLIIIHDLLEIKDPLIALVTFHSLLNFIGIVCVFPFLKYFTAFIDKYITGNEVSLAKQIAVVNPAESHTSLEALESESMLFYNKAIGVLHNFFHLSYDHQPNEPIQTYADLKNYENEIVKFYIKVQQTSLNEAEVSKINRIIAVIRNATLSAKNVKDIKHNLDELYNSPHDDIFAFYSSVRENQRLFYDEISSKLRNPLQLTADVMLKMKDLHKSKYNEESEGIYKLFTARKHHEIIIPDLLNMIREIDESNEALLRSLHGIMATDENSAQT